MEKVINNYANPKRQQQLIYKIHHVVESEKNTYPISKSMFGLLMKLEPLQKDWKQQVNQMILTLFAQGEDYYIDHIHTFKNKDGFLVSKNSVVCIPRS